MNWYRSPRLGSPLPGPSRCQQRSAARPKSPSAPLESFLRAVGWPFFLTMPGSGGSLLATEFGGAARARPVPSVRPAGAFRVGGGGGLFAYFLDGLPFVLLVFKSALHFLRVFCRSLPNMAPLDRTATLPFQQALMSCYDRIYLH